MHEQQQVQEQVPVEMDDMEDEDPNLTLLKQTAWFVTLFSQDAPEMRNHYFEYHALHRFEDRKTRQGVIKKDIEAHRVAVLAAMEEMPLLLAESRALKALQDRRRAMADFKEEQKDLAVAEKKREREAREAESARKATAKKAAKESAYTNPFLNAPAARAPLARTPPARTPGASRPNLASDLRNMSFNDGPMLHDKDGKPLLS